MAIPKPQPPKAAVNKAVSEAKAAAPASPATDAAVSEVKKATRTPYINRPLADHEGLATMAKDLKK